MNEECNRLQTSDYFGDGEPEAPDDPRSAWDFGDLDGYLREGEPGRAERAENWATAIGLQAVDGLKTSAYLAETAREHIEGRIDIAEAQRRIRSYYDEREGREEVEGEQEADIVSSRIAELLGERAFTFSPTELCDIHRRLFDQVLPRAGRYRTYNVTKKEWVLKGNTVYYATCGTIADTLRYDFEQERAFSYEGLSEAEAVRHFAQFVSSLWQIHPFGEGNTRTTAVFAIKYLRSMGYEVNNEPFKTHSWYFRNALVRANYEDMTRGIASTTRYLELFFENLLCGANNELRNRYLHLDWGAWQAASQETAGTGKETQQVTDHDTSKETLGTSKETADTSKEISKTSKDVRERILTILREDPSCTAVGVAQQLGLTPQGVRYHLDILKKAGRIHHEGSTKSGRWVINEQA